MRQSEELDDEQDFGALLKILRVPRRVKQTTVVALLLDKGWTATSYTRLENGDVAPSFDQLLSIYRALFLAGVSFSLADRQQFVERARKKIDSKKTHRDRHTDAEWAQLRYELARLDGLAEVSTALAARSPVPHKPLLADTEHLIGRESWREEVLAALRATPRPKLLVMHGPAGIGKSSELNWLATYFFCQAPTTHRVILCDLRALQRTNGPEDGFCVLMGTILTELGAAEALPPLLSLDEHLRIVLAHLEKHHQPLVIFLDHAEGVLQEQGLFAPCWQHLFRQVLRGQHRITLVVATTHWPGWYEGERCFVSEHAVPPLPTDKGILLLQQHGLDRVPIALLVQVYNKVGGIPLALEWVAALVKAPLQVEDWEAFETAGSAGAQTQSMARAIERLLAEPHIFGGTLADDVAPLLQRILATQHLSEEAHRLLQVLAVATIALAKPALQVLCPQGPRPIKELRRASVLVAYPDRVQLLPTVAAAMYRRLTPEQRHEQESILLQAYTAWLEEGTFHEQDSEQGTVITEMAVLLLKHDRLLEAAEHIIRYGCISFNLGHGPRLARLAKDVMRRFDWHSTTENECAGILLHYFLSPFVGEVIDYAKRYVEYQYILHAVIAEKIMLHYATQVHIIHHMMFCVMLQSRFEEAQTLFERCYSRLEPLFASDVDLETDVLEERASLLRGWSAYLEEQGKIQEARALRDQCIALYRQCCDLLTHHNEVSSLQRHRLMKRLAAFLNNLAYQLNRNGQFAEALQAEEQSIALKEQGYRQFGGLAASYGEKSQILAGLGRFREALQFDEMAVADAQQSAGTNHTFSQEDLWIYYVNRGRLYLRLGRVTEAERLLQEALSQETDTSRRSYRMFAKEALDEIDQWRRNAASSRHQLDWRWVERYRELAAYDSHGWLAPTGPFTQEEQQQWDALFPTRAEQAVKEQLGTLITQARERELAAAIAQQREPRLRYPAIEIEDVRRRLTTLLELDTEINQNEPNAIVRRLYHGAIEEEVDYLHLIEATYEGDTEKYWACNLRLMPLPTAEEVAYGLSHIKRLVLQGLKKPESAEVSQRFSEFLHTRLHVSLDPASNSEDTQEAQTETSPSSTQSPDMVSIQATKRFFEAALQESGYEGWQVVIDAAATHPRIEQGLRQFFLPNKRFSLNEIKYWFTHELAGHVARCIAGERSSLGLLGIHTKNSLPTEEGLALYHERQIAALHGASTNETGIWTGALATGLASGVVTPPQTFLPLCTFFENYAVLNQLLKRPRIDRQRAQQEARKYALSICLRIYRGVPDLERAGVCYLQDAVGPHYPVKWG